MAGRNNNNDRKNQQKPAAKPSRLDQFADEMFDSEKPYQGVTSRKEKRKWTR